ncbi:MAG: GHKL domain-containing protein [Synergistaceae bacterium]|nr:GHKL domain-containing protein [Synergistaceae bacterium]
MKIFTRYALELAIIIPDAVFLYLPLIEDLRWGNWLTYSISGVLLSIFVMAAAWVSAAQMLPVIPVLVVSVMFLFLIFFFSVKITLGRKLFCFFTSIMMGAFCLLYSISLMAEFEAANDLWASTRLLTLESCFVSLGLSALIGIVFFKMKNDLSVLLREERINVIWDFLFLLPFGATVLIWWLTPIWPKILLMGRARLFMLVLLPMIPFTVLLIYYLLWWVAAKMSESARLQQESTMLQMESKRYAELRTYMEETRALRHDFRQHILVIIQLSEAEKFSELLEYLSQFKDKAGKRYKRYCDNVAVDAIASYYTSFAESQDTRIEWSLNLPKGLPLRESEYCVILGNLLENALRAVKNLNPEQRYVKVISSLLSDTIIGISVDNPFRGKMKLGKNGLPRSEREGHGIGLVSVLNTVKRYDGTMKVTAEKNIFSVDIVLHSNAG